MFRFFLPTLAVAILAVIFLYFRYQTEPFKSGDYFTLNDLEIPLYDLYDLGVADANDDGLLDIYTVNHSAQQALLINQGKNQFQDKFVEFGLSQDYRYSEIEDHATAPVFNSPGVYIYRKKKNLYINSHDTDTPFGASIHLPWPIKVLKNKNSSYLLSTSDKFSTSVDNSRIDFTIEPGGMIVVNGEQRILELPHEFILDPNTDLNSIFLGHKYLHPDSHQIKLDWRDRHSMAWVDLNNDKKTDVVISRGGVKGRIRDVPVAVTDEIFVNNGGKFFPSGASARLIKGHCPARQTAWVDADGNDYLDLYQSCGRYPVPGYPNQLHSRNSDLSFNETAVALGLNYDRISVFKWFDSDNDNDMDLLSVETGTLKHYENLGGEFKETTLIKDLFTIFVQIVPGDFDADGFTDAIAVSRAQSTLLKNTNGKFQALSPSTLNLVDSGRSAAWVDYNNDGLMDFHSVPNGLYKQLPDGKFQRTGLLSNNETIKDISQSRCTWADTDANGAVDLICAIQRNYPTEVRYFKNFFYEYPEVRYWQSYLFNNNDTMNNWLQIDLVGKKGNPQAIGAKVQIDVRGNIQSRIVGGAEGSHYSQGHYRMYFGLAQEPKVDELTVFWPDGTKTNYTNVDTNQLLTIKYGSN